MLRDPELILRRWVRFFSDLLNGKSDDLDHSIIAGIPQHPIAHARGVEPTEEEVASALRSMANAKAVEPDELPVELLKLGLHHDTTVLREFHRVITRVWRDGQVLQRWRDAVLKALHNKREDGLRQLSWYLARGARGQGPPQDSCYETRRLL